MKNKFVVGLIVVLGCGIAACSEKPKYAKAEIIAAQKILETKQKYAKEISQAISECVKSANSIRDLTASGNDAEETVEACRIAVERSFGTYSQYYDRTLYEIANSDVGDIK